VLKPLRRWTTGLMLLALAASPLVAQAKKSDSVVKIEATAARPDAAGMQEVTVTLTVDKAYHLYANPVPEDFPGIPVTLTFTAQAKPADATITYPKGKEINDATIGKYRVYEDKVEIKAKLHRARGDDGPLEMSLKIQACNDRTCLPPTTVKKTVIVK
jgi:DsbC/DsbD-like thiol-disulfide interchange protein